ncbi:MAG: hypothetical protein BroJett029_29100 [Alphaproteobacteria bacterium]|nr:MAG: hypothetical protein BroJett029_29100 [Alphaproteobacteria bacterium]
MYSVCSALSAASGRAPDLLGLLVVLLLAIRTDSLGNGDTGRRPGNRPGHARVFRLPLGLAAGRPPLRLAESDVDWRGGPPAKLSPDKMVRNPDLVLSIVKGFTTYCG